MHFSEDDLRQALRRKDPGAEFTKRVMAAIEQERHKHPKQETSPGIRFGWWPLRLHPALAGMLAVALLAAGSWLGIERYREHQVEIAQAAKARQQAILALKITNAKLNHVFRRVNQQQEAQPKSRRESL